MVPRSPRAVSRSPARGMASCGFGPLSRGLAGLGWLTRGRPPGGARAQANGEADVEPGRFRLATDESATAGASTTSSSSMWAASTTTTSPGAPAGQFNELEDSVEGEPWRRLRSSLASLVAAHGAQISLSEHSSSDGVEAAGRRLVMDEHHISEEALQSAVGILGACVLLRPWHPSTLARGPCTACSPRHHSARSRRPSSRVLALGFAVPLVLPLVVC